MLQNVRDCNFVGVRTGTWYRVPKGLIQGNEDRNAQILPDPAADVHNDPIPNHVPCTSL